MAVYTTIDDPGLYFNTVLYVGNQPSSNPITGVGFQPDFVWVKDRDASKHHVLFNSVQGLGQSLYADTTGAAVTDANGITAFGADGFTVADWSEPNTSGDDYAAWCWKAGTTTGIDTTGSTITPSSYTFNATSKFSIIGYAGNSTIGATLPHGLGVAPDMISIKRLTSAGAQWACPFTAMKADWEYTLHWETNAARTDSTAYWNDTPPTAVNIVLGTDSGVNTGHTYIAYCWASVKGYSKFGKYLGNGNVDGRFVYTGFRPAYVYIKAIDSTDAWILYDDKRLGYNEENDYFRFDTTDVEASDVPLDILSNGFKIRDSGNETNAAADYVYAAFAHSPLVNSEGVPANAR